MDLVEFQKMWGDFLSLRVLQSRDIQKDLKNGFVVALYGKKDHPYRATRIGRIYDSPFGVIEFSSRFLNNFPELKNVVVVREKTDPREFVYSIYDKDEYKKQQGASNNISVLRKGGAASYSKDPEGTPNRRHYQRGSSMVLAEKLPAFGTLEPGPRYKAQRQEFNKEDGEQRLSGVLNAQSTQIYDVPVNEIAAVTEKLEELELAGFYPDEQDNSGNAEDTYAADDVDTLQVGNSREDKVQTNQNTHCNSEKSHSGGGRADSDSGRQSHEQYNGMSDTRSHNDAHMEAHQLHRANSNDVYTKGFDSLSTPSDCPSPFDFNNVEFNNLSAQDQVKILKDAVIVREAALCRFVYKLQCLKEIFDNK